MLTVCSSDSLDTTTFGPADIHRHGTFAIWWLLLLVTQHLICWIFTDVSVHEGWARSPFSIQGEFFFFFRFLLLTLDITFGFTPTWWENVSQRYKWWGASWQRGDDVTKHHDQTIFWRVKKKRAFFLLEVLYDWDVSSLEVQTVHEQTAVPGQWGAQTLKLPLILVPFIAVTGQHSSPGQSELRRRAESQLRGQFALNRCRALELIVDLNADTSACFFELRRDIGRPLRSMSPDLSYLWGESGGLIPWRVQTWHDMTSHEKHWLCFILSGDVGCISDCISDCSYTKKVFTSCCPRRIGWCVLYQQSSAETFRI